jgi:SAM-dependent methyltransferase
VTSSFRRSRAWERNAGFWIRIIRERLDPFRTELTDRAMLRAVGPCRGQAVLDAGCGEGYMSRLLAQRGARVVGVDRSPALIQAAAGHGRGRAGAARFVLGDISTLPVVSGGFDGVVCNHSLNEMRDPRPALSECARVLRPGGRLVALMLHPCFYGGRDTSGRRIELDSDRYFSSRRLEQRFSVSGLSSPAPTVLWMLPLEAWFSALAGTGFYVQRLLEPRPAPSVAAEPWWRENFRRPLFLLLVAVRQRSATAADDP